MEASNDPHGVFSFASSSHSVEFTEQLGGAAYLLIDRKFGSIGKLVSLVIGGFFPGIHVYYTKEKCQTPCRSFSYIMTWP